MRHGAPFAKSEAEYAAFLLRYRGQAVAVPALVEPTTPSDYAAVLCLQIVEAALGDPALAGQWFREFTFHESRNWRLDVACPGRKLAIEVDGGVHRIKKRFLGDIEKHNALVFAGWTYLRVTPEQVRTGEALALVRAYMAHGAQKPG